MSFLLMAKIMATHKVTKKVQKRYLHTLYQDRISSQNKKFKVFVNEVNKFLKKILIGKSTEATHRRFEKEIRKGVHF